MVDLRLDALDLNASSANNDMYVAVRIGEAQKLSRISATRSYKFNQATVSDRKFGRLDVFRRVGTASINIKNSASAETADQVEVALKNEAPLKFRVCLAPETQEKRVQKAEKAMSSEPNPKVLEAKHYLLEHNLEERLSHAMQAVLRDRPEDPAMFISEMLRVSAGDYKRINLAASPKAQKQDIAKAPSGSAWSQKPSIGTWLTARPAAAAPAKAGNSAKAESLRTEAKEVLLKASMDGVLESKLLEALAGSSDNTWKMKPSIGTWIMEPPLIEPDNQRPLMMLPTQMMYGAAFASTGLRPNFMII